MLTSKQVRVLLDIFPVRFAPHMLNEIVSPRESLQPGACTAGNRAVKQFTVTTVDRVAVPVEAVSCREWFRRASIVITMTRDFQGAPLPGAFMRATKVGRKVRFENRESQGLGGGGRFSLEITTVGTTATLAIANKLLV